MRAERPIVFGATLDPAEAPLAEVAARLAARAGAPLRLVHVCEDPRAPIVLGTSEEPILGPVRARLDAEAARLRPLAGAAVDVHLAAGEVAESLVSVASFELAKLLIVGSDRSARRPMRGATAERAARRSAVPVLALRAPDRLLAWLGGERPLRVLVGADLGRASEAARAFAADLARLGPVEVEVAIVVAPDESHTRLGLPAPRDGALSPAAEASLLRDLARGAPPGEAARLTVVPGRGAADAHLAGLADRGGFDLVVVGQRRRSLVEQLWYGSVARGVLRAAPVAVASIPAAALPAPPPFRPARLVLAATDLGEAAERTVVQALGLVDAGGAVHLAHVIASGGRELDRQADRERAWLALARLAEDGAATVERHVLEGDPAEQILALAERLGADRVVLAARSSSRHGGLGAVAAAIAGQAKVPVLIVPGDPS